MSPATAAVPARREAVRGNVVLCDVCCYGCCARQQRVNVSAAPRALRIFSHPFSLHPAYPGFSEQWGQCEQQEGQCEQRKSTSYETS